MSEQLVLDLPHRPALGADDFLVSSCNELAVGLIDAWPSWSGRAQLIEGPGGSGKSHLANVWRLRTNAYVLDPGELDGSVVPEPTFSSGVIIEDLDRTPFDDKALFHLLNLSREQGFDVLFTARVPPARWDIGLPDLMSRLKALPAAQIDMPDDILLRAVLLKHFSDRQLIVDPQVLKYLARHMVRSMETARGLVAALDHAALASGKKITRQLAGEILKQFQADEQTPPEK